MSARRHEAPFDPARLPAHVAIIMDGNGRWARKRRLPRIWGHREGAKRVDEVVRAARELGVRYLTLYSFSKENWSRPKEEVRFLMDLLERFLVTKLPKMKKNGVRFNVIGDPEDLPARVRRAIERSRRETRENTALTLTLALSYGSRFEIAQAAQAAARDVAAGRLAPEAITPERFASYLYTKDLPDVDLLIRTSGELRISNFLLWQISYAEIYVTQTLWPAFGRPDFMRALAEFGNRERRFGRTAPLAGVEENLDAWKQPAARS